MCSHYFRKCGGQPWKVTEMNRARNCEMAWDGRERDKRMGVMMSAEE